MDKPWKCMMTGECCRRVHAVTVTEAELEAVQKARPDVSLEVTRRADGFLEFRAGPCPYLGPEGRCSVYEHRPLNCRRWMCGRMSKDEPLTDLSPVPVKVLLDRDLRRQYALNQRRAMARWGHRMGWQDNGA